VGRLGYSAGYVTGSKLPANVQNAIWGKRLRTRRLVRLALMTGVGLGAFGGVAFGQFSSAASAVSSEAGSASSLIFKGIVLNRVTRAPVGRALVFSADQQMATMTDDRGRFEFKTGAASGGDSGNGDSASAFSPGARTTTTRYFQVRKPGYLDSGQMPVVDDGSSAGDATIYLKPEALIVGKIISGDAEHVLRFNLQLYKQEFRQGQEHWQQAGNFMTWSDGEFRFAGLAAGTYKVVSTEQMDQEFQFGQPRGQEFGYPATFYPGVADFATASVIRVAPGETFEANFTVTRRPYYPVRIPVANGPEQGLNPVVYPLGHPGPGFSLGYNPGEQAIVGLLPDGAYTVSAESYGPKSAAGMTNFSVQGEAPEGAGLNMVPSVTLMVNVKELFRSTDKESTPGLQAGSRLMIYAGGGRNPGFQLELDPAEDFGLARPQNSQPVGDSTNALEIPGIVPGKYTVRASPTQGYASSVLYGGVELLRQPLVVGLGGLSSPIEVTLRDDGAQVQGEVEDDETAPAATGMTAMKPPRFLHFVPMPGSTGQYRETSSNSQGAFIESQLPPGDYLVLAFSGGDPNLHLSFAEAIAKYSTIGQVISVPPEQKLQLRLKAIAEEP
jgi:hypothetical protein